AYPILTIARCKTANPIIVVDEIDKTTPGGHNGDIHWTLLTLLEQQTAAVFFDECLLTNCNLSQISWILTANDVHSLPRPLLSRLRVIRVGRPAAEHFDRLLAG